MKLLARSVLAAALVMFAAPAWAFNCPVVIKQAEDLIKKAGTGKSNADSKPLLDEAKKQLAEARMHHETAKAKKDHGDAVRKGKVAAAFAEEAIVLSAASAPALNAPVVIRQAEDLIKKAETGKSNADTKPLLDEARKQLAEAKAHQETSKTTKDKGDAVRKAKVAAAFAEEAIVLQSL
jgi:hypothetical protein